MSRFVFLLLFLLVIGCSGSDPSFQKVSLDEEFILAPDGRAQVDGRMTLTFDTLADDSRCPQGANCAWEGDAAVEMQYQSPDHPPIRFSLHTSSRYSGDTTIQGRTIRLIDVQPVPVVDQEIDHTAYRVKLRVERP